MNIIVCSLGEKGFRSVKVMNSLLAKPNTLRVLIGQDQKVQNDYSFELIEFCKKNNITHEITNQSNLKDSTYDYVIAIGWRWIIQSIPEEKLIIFHDSLLPKYRGFAPLVNALLNKDPQVGVTALFGAKEYDRGNILGQAKHFVSYPTNIQKEISRICSLYETLIAEILPTLIRKSLNSGVPQLESEATYSLWRDEEDYRIKWEDRAEDISHFISCLGYPYAGASAIAENQAIRVISADQLPDVKIENRAPGKIIFVQDGHPVIVCGQGLLKILDCIDVKGTSLIPWRKFKTRLT